MAKHGRRGRRRRRRYLRGVIHNIITLGTLAPGVAIADAFDDTVVEEAFVTSVDATWSLSNYTPATNDGPIMVGLAHGDYTASEIESWIENLGSWDIGDKVTQEIARRQIRHVGTFRIPPGLVPNEVVVLEEGQMIHTKCNWGLATGQTLKAWAYNLGTSSLTTGATVQTDGVAHIWPK